MSDDDALDRALERAAEENARSRKRQDEVIREARELRDEVNRLPGPPHRRRQANATPFPVFIPWPDE